MHSPTLQASAQYTTPNPTVRAGALLTADGSIGEAESSHLEDIVVPVAVDVRDHGMGSKDGGHQIGEGSVHRGVSEVPASVVHQQPILEAGKGIGEIEIRCAVRGHMPVHVAESDAVEVRCAVPHFPLSAP